MPPVVPPHRRRRVRIQQRSSAKLAVPLKRWLLVAVVFVGAVGGMRFVADEYRSSHRDETRRAPNRPAAVAAVAAPAAVPVDAPATRTPVADDVALLPVNSGHGSAFAPVTDSLLARLTASAPAPVSTSVSTPYAAPTRNVAPASAPVARVAVPEHSTAAPRAMLAAAPVVSSGSVTSPASPVVAAPVSSAPTSTETTRAPSKAIRSSSGPVTNGIPIPVVFTWSGGGAATDATWSNGGNWVNGVPPVMSLAESNDVTFTSTPATATTSTVDGTYGIGFLTFDAGTPSYTLGDGGSASLGLNNAGGITDNSTNAQTINPVTTLSLAVTLNTAAGAQLNLNGATATFIAPASVLTVTGAGNTTISGNVTPGSPANLGDGSIVKSGAGTLVLAGDNSYTGGTTLNAGTLDVRSNTALGTGTFTVNGGTIANNFTDNNGFGISVVLANNVVLAGDLDHGSSSASLEFDGNVDLGTATRTITASNANTFFGFPFQVYFNGVISAGNTTAGLTFSNSASDQFVLSGPGANTYTGLTTVDGASLSLVKTGPVTAIAGDLTVQNNGLVITNGGQLAATTNLTVNSGGTFDATGFSGGAADETINRLDGDSTGTVTIGNQFTRTTLTVNAGTMNGLIQDGFVIEEDRAAGARVTPADVTLTGGALAKVSADTLTLTHNNTYSGGTTVNAGTLLANNVPGLGTDSATGTGPVQVNAGGTLGGFGTVGYKSTDGLTTAAVTIGDGGSTPAILAPGSNGIGRISMLSTLTMASNAELDIELGGATPATEYDQAFIGGALTLGGTLNVKLVNGFVPFDGEKFYILDVTVFDTITGEFTNVTNGMYTDAAGDMFKVNYDDFDPAFSGGRIQPQFGLPGNAVSLAYIAAVPEPGSFAVAGLGLAAGLAGFVRRRRQLRAL